jgi:hypothetical protein
MRAHWNAKYQNMYIVTCLEVMDKLIFAFTYLEIVVVNLLR